MSTVKQLNDRIFREWLSPPGSEPVMFRPAAAALVGDTSLTVDTTWLTPEEELLLGGGGIVENHDTSELQRIHTYDDATDTIVVTRGAFGTTPAAVGADDLLYLNPKFTRASVLSALGDAIDNLSPPLYGLTDTTVVATGTGQYVEAPADMEAVVSAHVQVDGSNWARPRIRFEPTFPPSQTGKALFVGASAGKTIHLTYKVRPARPSAETQTLAELNLDESWRDLLIVGTLARLASANDFDALTTDFITDQLEAQNIPVGTGVRLRSSLEALFHRLVTQAHRHQSRKAPFRKTRNGVYV